MELNEAVHRIIGQHWRLILLLSVLGVGAVGLLHLGEARTYTASARAVLDTQDPKSQPESAAIADTAKAIVTSPSQVRSAIRKSRVTGRDPVDIAKHDVAVQALGGSGVLQISVSDPSPRVAAGIADALAAGLIQVRLGVTQGQVQQALAALDKRIDELNRKISRLDARIDALVVRSATRSPQHANAARAGRDEATRTRDFLAQQRAVRESERVNLLSTLALRPKPSIISAADVPERADPSGALPDILLGALLGLVLGVGLAGLIETLRPTLVGGDALARELDVPLLGTLKAAPDGDPRPEHATSVAARLRMSAEAEHVRSVTLIAAGEQIDVGRLAERLQTVAQGLDGAASRADAEPLPGLEAPVDSRRVRLASEAKPAVRRAVSIRAYGLDNSSLKNGGATGLVLVAPATLKKSDLGATTHLLKVSPAPLLGVITYTADSMRRDVRVSPAPLLELITDTAGSIRRGERPDWWNHR